MRHRTTLMFSLALLVASPTASFAEEQIDDEREAEEDELDDERDRDQSDGTRWTVLTPGTVAARAGAFSGRSYRHDSGGVSELQAEVTPTLARGAVELSAPLELEYRETYGAQLREIDGEVGLEAKWAATEQLTIEPAFELARTWRPGWPDLYQPIPGAPTNPPSAPDEFESTDRYGYLSWEVGAGAEYRFLEDHSVEVSYQLDSTIYDKDPNYSPVQDVDPEPTHLVPYDNLAHEVFLRWRYAQDNWRVGASLDLEAADYEYVFARDADTGLTHAGPGGPPPNPLYSTLEYEPAIEGRVELYDEHLRLDAQLGYAFQDDRYQGYYSYSGIHPEFEARWKFDGGSTLGAGVELEWREYGPNSYEATPGWQPGDSGHPPLSFGDRRVDHRFDAELEGETPLGENLVATLEAEFAWRDTNFPDYEPGVFPRTRNYDIQWSYTDWELLAGIAYDF